MARAHFVKKARKDQPGGIKAGDSYYWWKFRHGGKHFSKTYPRLSQLTQSEYLSTAYALQEQIEDMKLDDLEAVVDELRSVADELRTLGSDQEDKIGNMPESLQQSATADLLQSRMEACEEVASELEAAADDIADIAEDEEEEDRYTRVEEVVNGISWSFDT